MTVARPALRYRGSLGTVQESLADLDDVICAGLNCGRGSLHAASVDSGEIGGTLFA